MGDSFTGEVHMLLENLGLMCTLSNRINNNLLFISDALKEGVLEQGGCVLHVNLWKEFSSRMSNVRFTVYSLGLKDFESVFDLQRRLARDVKEAKRDNCLLLLRHYPVFTIGRAGSKKNILVSDDLLNKKGLSVYYIERGGDITYHGPGQLIAYPIWYLSEERRDIHTLVRNLEEVCVHLLENCGISPQRRPSLPGLWVPDLQFGYKKIASVGIAIRHWVTFHGIAVNVTEEDQEYFDYINPCGLNSVIMSSVEMETREVIPWEKVEDMFIIHFRNIMNVEMSKGDLAELYETK
jgi:lipoyl(octanoyl) transferase